MFVVRMHGPSTARCVPRRLIFKVARKHNVEFQAKLMSTAFGLGPNEVIAKSYVYIYIYMEMYIYNV